MRHAHGCRLLAEEDIMKTTYDKGPFQKMPRVVLSGLLVLSMCPTTGFAEQIRAASEEMVPDGTPTVEAQGTNGEPLLVEPRDAGNAGSVVGAQDASGEDVGLTAQSVGDGSLGLTAQDDGIPWKGWTNANSLPNDPDYYRLETNVTLADTWTVTAPDTVPLYLDLNGHSITLGQTAGEQKEVIRIVKNTQGAPCKLVLSDSGENPGTITHETGKKGTGVWVGDGGEFVMEGGSISGNDADNYGGGVYVGSGGTFTLGGGTISGNAAGLQGGGVAVEGGTFTMRGGTIQNNGGGYTLYGGGVCVYGGTFKLLGGIITSNKASKGGGVAGYWLDDSAGKYHITLSGNPQVTGNFAQRENYDNLGDNLCLIRPSSGEDTPLTIDGTLGEDAKIGISTIRDNSLGDDVGNSFEYTDGVFTTGYKQGQNGDPWSHFTSDDPDRGVFWTPDGKEAQLAVPRHISVDQDIAGGKVTVGRDVAAEGTTMTIQATPDEGWELVSVTAKGTDGKDVEVRDNKEFIVPASDVVVSATFKEKPAPPTPPGPPTPPTPPGPLTPPAPTPVDVHVAYTAHVQDKGDLPGARDGEVIGTTGESRRLEAMSATVDTGGIEYRAHLQDKGWDGWVADGKQAGTTGESRRVEAIQMRLTGSAATDGHHVWYRVHSQDYGWLGWACDGEPAGTAGMSKRVEAYQVVVLKGDAKPGDYDASKPAYRSQVTANAHLQESGWTGNAGAGIIGTTGQSRHMEGLRLSVPNQPFAGGIAYQVHEQGNGWTAERSDGALAGTTGESRRIEAVKIRLTGELAGHMSVWYRVHSQNFGWSGWTCDGAPAGTEGLSLRAEAVDIRILSKDASAPGSTANAFHM